LSTLRAPHSRAGPVPHPASRFNNRATCDAYQRSLPAGVRIPRSLSASAMPFRLVTPAACSALTIGASFAALSAARAWRASMPARRTAGVRCVLRVSPSLDLVSSPMPVRSGASRPGTFDQRHTTCQFSLLFGRRVLFQSRQKSLNRFGASAV
jgi:hypothetical protein